MLAIQSSYTLMKSLWLPSNDSYMAKGKTDNVTKWLPFLSHCLQFGWGFPGNTNLVSHWGQGEMWWRRRNNPHIQRRPPRISFLVNSPIGVSRCDSSSALFFPHGSKITDENLKSQMFFIFTLKLKGQGRVCLQLCLFIFLSRDTFL